MMNILLMDGLPEDYKGIPISPDYRNMIQVDMILRDPELSDVERAQLALPLLYPEVPEDIRLAIEGLEWFYARGHVEDVASGDGRTPQKGKTKRAFDFEQDANLIYAAFRATYNLDLADVEYLHWWAFMALFEGLPETTLIQRVIYWRTADTTGMSKTERKHVMRMRNLFALKTPEREPMDIKEVEQRTLDWAARRFEEAKKAAGKA